MSLMEVEDDDDSPLFWEEDKESVSSDSEEVEDWEKDEAFADSEDEETQPKSKKQKTKEKEDMPEPKEEEEMNEDALVEYETPEQLTPAQEIGRARILSQLMQVKINPILRGKVVGIHPGFFEQDFTCMSLKDLVRTKREVECCFQIHNVRNGIQTQYQAASMILKGVVQYGIGYDGPGLNQIDHLFQEDIAMDMYYQLGKLKPAGNARATLTERLLGIAVPSMNILWQLKDTKQLREKGNIPMDEEELQRWTSMLPE